MNTSNQRCIICGRRAEFACDYVVSETPRGVCGHQLCREHAATLWSGWVGGEPSSIEYCPAHRAATLAQDEQAEREAPGQPWSTTAEILDALRNENNK
jgi:hypothetical protein